MNLKESKAILSTMPLFCPKCGRIMNKRLDKKMWNFHNKCFDCVVEEESLMVERGQWEEYSEKMIEKNIISELKSQKQHIEEYLFILNKIEFVQNSSGDIEKWNFDPERVKEVKDKYEQSLIEINEYLSKMENGSVKKENEEIRTKENEEIRTKENN